MCNHIIGLPHHSSSTRHPQRLVDAVLVLVVVAVLAAISLALVLLMVLDGLAVLVAVAVLWCRAFSHSQNSFRATPRFSVIN